MKKVLLLVCCALCASWSVWAIDFDQIQIHGFASQGYLRSNRYDYLVAETKKGTVEFNEFGINVMANMSDRLRLGIQFLARDLGDNGNDKLVIDWAFGDYRYRNWLGFRFGKMKKAFGLYNQSRDIDAARNGIFLPLGVYPEDARLAQQSVKGFGVYGSVSTGFVGSFNYQIQYGTLDSDFELFLKDDPDILSANVADNDYMLHAGWNTPLDGLKVVGSYNHESWFQSREAEPDNMEFDLARNAWVVGMEYMIGNLTCAVEYTQATFEMAMKGYPNYEWTTEAYYGLLAYRLTDWFEVGASYSVIYGDKEDKEGTRYDWQQLPRALGWSKDLALTTRFDLSESWILKLEGHWLNGLYSTATNGGMATYQDYGADPDENGFLLAAKVTFSF